MTIILVEISVETECIVQITRLFVVLYVQTQTYDIAPFGGFGNFGYHNRSRSYDIVNGRRPPFAFPEIVCIADLHFHQSTFRELEKKIT